MFIDTTGAACVGTVKALTVADLVLVPITPNPEDVECFEMESVQFFDAIPGANKKIGRLIINRMDMRWFIQNFFKRHLEELVSKYPVCKTRLGSRVDYVNARAEGKGVVEFNRSGKAASEINDLYAELTALL